MLILLIGVYPIVQVVSFFSPTPIVYLLGFSWVRTVCVSTCVATQNCGANKHQRNHPPMKQQYDATAAVHNEYKTNCKRTRSNFEQDKDDDAMDTSDCNLQSPTKKPKLSTEPDENEELDILFSNEKVAEKRKCKAMQALRATTATYKRDRSIVYDWLHEAIVSLPGLSDPTLLPLLFATCEYMDRFMSCSPQFCAQRSLYQLVAVACLLIACMLPCCYVVIV